MPIKKKNILEKEEAHGSWSKSQDEAQKELDENVAIESKGDKLSPRQELFCQLYTSKEFYGNWVQTYIEVYDPDQSKPNWYKIACQSASQILSNIKVCNRINDLLDTSGFNSEFVDKQHLFLITQHTDLWVKGRMIDSFNKLKGRITDKIEHSGTITALAGIADITANNTSPTNK